MSAAFFRFPHTPHVAWLGQGKPRGDKLLSPQEVASLLAGEVVVEEKIDGANLGFSTTEDGELRAQNRGTWLDAETSHPQFKPLWSWLAARRGALVDALWPHNILFGEWCSAVHSVSYNSLPDWFLGFDVYDREAGRFWDTTRRDELLSVAGVCAVPRLARGHFQADGLANLLGRSKVGAGSMEGLVVRSEADGWTQARGKLVRAEFTQAIDTHWSKGRLEHNHLAIHTPGASAWP